VNRSAIRGATRARQAGLTLIELLVSIALGILIMGIVVIVFLSTNLSSKAAQAQGRMNEDAQIALEMLAQEIRKAGYNPVRSNGAQNDLGQAGWGIVACDTGFKDATVASMASLECNNSGTSSAIAVTYEGDIYSGKLTSATPAKLLDCIGNGISGTGSYFIVQSRLDVDGNGLSCRGSGDLTQSQTLVDNIQSMHLRFAVSDPSQATSANAFGYLSATEINTPVSALATFTSLQRWNKVLAVRICVVVRSESAVISDLAGDGINPTYYDCDGNSIDITDGFFRKAYRTTVILRNHGVGYVDK